MNSPFVSLFIVKGINQYDRFNNYYPKQSQNDSALMNWHDFLQPIGYRANLDWVLIERGFLLLNWLKRNSSERNCVLLINAEKKETVQPVSGNQRHVAAWWGDDLLDDSPTCHFWPRFECLVSSALAHVSIFLFFYRKLLLVIILLYYFNNHLN